MNTTIKDKKKIVVILLVAILLLIASSVIMLHFSSATMQAYSLFNELDHFSNAAMQANSLPNELDYFTYEPSCADEECYDFMQTQGFESMSINELSLSDNIKNALLHNMQRNYFFVSGQRRYIQDYYSQFYRRSVTDGRISRVRGPSLYQISRPRGDIDFVAPDPITNFIPRAVFEELATSSQQAGMFTLIGCEWGVIIDMFTVNSIRYFTVQVIDINMSDNIDRLNYPQNRLNRFQNIFHIEVSPLFELEFVWLTNTSGRIWIEDVMRIIGGSERQRNAFHRSRSFEYNFTVPSNQINNLFPVPVVLTLFDHWNHIFSHRNRNHIRNVSMSARLANAQHANPRHDSRYYVWHDYGAFFHGQDLFGRAYNPANFSFNGSNNTGFNFEMASMLAGHIPLAGDYISFGIDLVDMIVNGHLQDHTRNMQNQSYFYNTPSEQFYFCTSNRIHHIQHNGYTLVRNATAQFSNPSAKLTVFSNFGYTSNMLARFFIAQQHYGTWPNHQLRGQRIRTEISFDIHRYQGGTFMRTERQTRERILREGYPTRTVEEGQPVYVYNYYQNTSRFRINVSEAGLHTLHLTNAGRFRNFTDERHFHTGWNEFELHYNHNGASISTLTVERVGPLQFMSLGNGQASVRLRDNFNTIPLTIYIPETALVGGGEYIVTQIAENGFANATFLSTITLPSTVTHIGNSAFRGISNLTSVNIASNSQLQTIGSYAFANTGLTQIEIPAFVTHIFPSAFYRATNLTCVEFAPSSQLANIGSNSFRRTRLTSIVIPQSVIGIGDNAFAFNSAILRIFIWDRSQMDTWHPNWNSRDGGNIWRYRVYVHSYEQPETIGNFWQMVDDVPTPWDRWYPPNSLNFEIIAGTYQARIWLHESYFDFDQPDLGYAPFVIPTHVMLDGVQLTVTQIADNGFRGFRGTEIVIPHTIQSIGEFAFADAQNLRTVHVERTMSHGGITTLGANAFSNTPSLSRTYVPMCSLGQYRTAANWSSHAIFGAGAGQLPIDPIDPINPIDSFRVGISFASEFQQQNMQSILRDMLEHELYGYDFEIIERVANNDIYTQSSHINEIMSVNIDLMVVFPVGFGCELASVLHEAHNNGLHIIIVGPTISDLFPPHINIGWDYFGTGAEQAQDFKDNYWDQGSPAHVLVFVCLICHGYDYLSGVQAVLQWNADIFVEVMFMTVGWGMAEALAHMEDWIAANSKLPDAIFSCCNRYTLGALQALKDTGLWCCCSCCCFGTLKIYCFNDRFYYCCGTYNYSYHTKAIVIAQMIRKMLKGYALPCEPILLSCELEYKEL